MEITSTKSQTSIETLDSEAGSLSCTATAGLIIGTSLGLNFVKLSSVKFLQEKGYCFSIKLPNAILDTFIQNPNSLYSRIIDGFKEDVFLRMSDLTQENIKMVFTYSLSELALIPLHRTIKKIQGTIFKKFFPDVYSINAIAIRIAIASLVIGLANYNTALDWDTRHHLNYSNDPLTKDLVDDYVCVQQSAYDARVLSAFLGAISHGFVYEVSDTFLGSLTWHAITNTLIAFHLYGDSELNSWFVHH